MQDAPKDGNEILVLWKHHERGPIASIAKWHSDDWGWIDARDAIFHVLHPFVWMPIPTAN